MTHDTIRYDIIRTKNTESVVDGNDHDLTERRHDTSVVRISGSVVVRVAVNEHDNRK